MKEARRVSDLMTVDVATVQRNDSLAVADRAMRERRIRHLPVLDDAGESVVGVLSRRDIFRGALARSLGYGEHALERLFGQLLVKEVMTNDPRTIAPDATLSEAADRMLEWQIGSLVVVDGERLVGILTAGDFLKAFTSSR